MLIAIFAPGFLDENDKYTLAVDMVRITFPYLLFISLTALAGGILNTYGQFSVPAFTPVLLNLSLIGAALWLAPYFAQPVIALAWGVLLAGIAQLAFQGPFLYRLGLLCRPRLQRGHPRCRAHREADSPGNFRRVGGADKPAGGHHDCFVSGYRSVSWLYYSDRIVEFPLGVFGIALATVILPSLSQDHAAGSPAAFSNTLDWALRNVLLIACPSTIGLAMLAGPILTTLFQYGAFSVNDVQMASLSLMAYSTGPGRVHLHQGTRPRLLCPPGYPYAGAYWRHRDGCQYSAQLGACRPACPYRIGFGDVSIGIPQRRLLFIGLCKAGVYTACPGWRSFLAKIVIANLSLLGFLWTSPGLSRPG